MSFKGSHKELKRADRVKFRDSLSRAKSYEDLDELLDGLWNGDKEIEEIIEFCDPRIQGIKEAIENAFGVNIDSHSLYFYGTKKD